MGVGDGVALTGAIDVVTGGVAVGDAPVPPMPHALSKAQTVAMTASNNAGRSVGMSASQRGSPALGAAWHTGSCGC